jgi:hypothetical protein
LPEASSLTKSTGIIVLDDFEGESDIDDAHLQSAAHMRARLKDASEHESRMRSTISSARRFALDLERTGSQPAPTDDSFSRSFSGSFPFCLTFLQFLCQNLLVAHRISAMQLPRRLIASVLLCASSSACARAAPALSKRTALHNPTLHLLLSLHIANSSSRQLLAAFFCP